MKLSISKEWCERAAADESKAGDPDMTAGTGEPLSFPGGTVDNTTSQRADLAQWPAPRPINTAPRDGTRVLVWSARSTTWTPAGWVLPAWWDNDNRPVLDATHWLPLPPSPGEGSK